MNKPTYRELEALYNDALFTIADQQMQINEMDHDLDMHLQCIDELIDQIEDAK